MSRAALTIACLCTACAPPEPELEPEPVDLAYTDRYTGMQAICQWAEYRETYADEGHAIEGPGDFDIPAYPSEACVDRVLEDLHVDIDAFLAFDDLESPYAVALDGGPVWHETFLGNPLSAARVLGLFEHGELADYRDAELVSDDFIGVLDEVVDETGQTSLAAAQYNFLAAAFERIVPGTEGGNASAAFTPSDGTVTYFAAYGPDPANLALLMHEARHALLDRPHTTCAGNAGIPNAVSACDTDYDGAFAFGISALATTEGAYVSGWMRDSMHGEAEANLRMINGCLADGEGLGDSWEQMLDRVFWSH